MLPRAESSGSTLKMITAEIVESSANNNSLSTDYLHPDDHAKQITDTPGYNFFYNPYNCSMTVRHVADVQASRKPKVRAFRLECACQPKDVSHKNCCRILPEEP